AMLDWTRNPLISIFFAFQYIPPGTQYVSIYAYKQLNDSKNNPVIIKYGHGEVENIRIRNQEGVFTVLQYPCTYYFVRKHWPSLDDYFSHSSGNFELIRYDIPVSYKDNLNNLARSAGYTKDFLLPED